MLTMTTLMMPAPTMTNTATMSVGQAKVEPNGKYSLNHNTTINKSGTYSA